MTAARRLVDIGEVARMLNARAEALCRELLPDGRRNGSEWLASSPRAAHAKLGQFNVHLNGAKAGVWSDFVAGDGGDALDLVAYVLFRGDKAQAFAWSRRWLGLESGDPAALERARRSLPSPDQAQARSREEQEHARSAAFRIWQQGGRPELLGTPVDAYLRGRGIPLAELPRLPRSIRYHPDLFHKESGRRWPAMVTAVCGPDNKFAACHRTWLEIQSNGQVTKAPVERNKMVLGVYRGGSIHLWAGLAHRALRELREDEVIDLTEGIEDGLSVAIAAPECRVLATISLSNLASVVLPPATRTVRIWRQNDKHPQAIDAFQRAARAHIAAGRTVLIPPCPAEVKDVNDLLRAG